MAMEHLDQTRGLQIGSAECALVEENFSKIISESVPVINPKVMDLVSPEEQSLRSESAENMVDPSQPLGHARVIRVLRLEREFAKKAAKLTDTWE